MLDTPLWLSFASGVTSSPFLSSLLTHVSPVPPPATFPGSVCPGCVCAPVPSGVYICPAWWGWKTPTHVSHLRQMPGPLGRFPFPYTPSPSLCCFFLCGPQPSALCSHPGCSLDLAMREYIRLFALSEFLVRITSLVPGAVLGIEEPLSKYLLNQWMERWCGVSKRAGGSIEEHRNLWFGSSIVLSAWLWAHDISELCGILLLFT